MLNIDVNFLGEEEEMLREIKAIPEQMIRILKCLKITKAPGPERVCPGDPKHKHLSRHNQTHLLTEGGFWQT